jgi:hypothetical protein
MATPSINNFVFSVYHRKALQTRGEARVFFDKNLI